MLKSNYVPLSFTIEVSLYSDLQTPSNKVVTLTNIPVFQSQSNTVVDTKEIETQLKIKISKSKFHKRWLTPTKLLKLDKADFIAKKGYLHLMVLDNSVLNQLVSNQSFLDNSLSNQSFSHQSQQNMHDNLLKYNKKELDANYTLAQMATLNVKV